MPAALIDAGQGAPFPDTVKENLGSYTAALEKLPALSTRIATSPCEVTSTLCAVVCVTKFIPIAVGAAIGQFEANC